MRDRYTSLSATLRCIVDVVGVENVCVWLVEDDVLIPAAFAGISSVSKSVLESILVDECVCGAVVRSGCDLMTNAPSDRSEFGNVGETDTIRSVVCIPVRDEGHDVIGVIHLASSIDPQEQAQVSSLIPPALLAQVTLEVENAWLRRRIGREERRLRDLSSAACRLQEEERARIAADLHDSTAQLILAMLYATEAIRSELQRDPGTAYEDLKFVQQSLQQIEKEIRQTIYDLHPPSLYTNDLASALRHHIERHNRSSPVYCALHVAGKPARLATDVRLGVYRVVQEALQNVTAHARAKSAYVGLHYRAEVLRVTVEDDGRGFDPQSVSQDGGDHLGLISMRERAEAIGAHLRVTSEPDKGTRLTLDLPMPVGEEEETYAFHSGACR